MKLTHTTRICVATVTGLLTLSLALFASESFAQKEGATIETHSQTNPKSDLPESHLIDKTGELGWQSSGKTTFAGALDGIMKASAHPASYDEIMGASGLAFRTRWHTPAKGKEFIGIAPVGELKEDSEKISQVFGLGLKVVDADPADATARNKVSKALIESILANQPVICYVNPNHDCAFVYGFKDSGKTFLVRDYYLETSKEQTFDKLGDVFWFLEAGKEKPLPAKKAFELGLKTAVKNFSRSDEPEMFGGKFAYGVKGFSAWRKAIEAADGDEKAPKLGQKTDWWVMSCLSDARTAAANYLRANRSLLGTTAQSHLKRAEALYREEANELLSVQEKNEAWAAPFSGVSWNAEIRAREIEVLKQCEKTEAEAISEIEKALSALKENGR